MSSSENPPDPADAPSAAPEAGEQLPVYLDEEAVEAMAGETMDAGPEGETDDAERLLAADVGRGGGAAVGKKADKGRRAGGIGWFKALFLFLFAQFLLVLILGAVFRKPLTQVYDRLVEKGYVKPGSLPWQSGGATRGEVASSVGDVEWEDVRLRHELTLLADAAIARGDRGALDELQGMLDVAEDPVQRAAARAEMFRVQQMYATASRLPRSPLQVAQLFPGKSSEEELDEKQIIELLTDPDREPETRMRAAWLLEGHRTMAANDKLILAIRNDKSIDVVKQAMISFQKNTGYQSGNWFDANAAETWWAENASRLAKEFSAGEPTRGDRPAAAPPRDGAGTSPTPPSVAPQVAPTSRPGGGAVLPGDQADRPAAAPPSATGPPEKKNLRPLPANPSEPGEARQ